MRRRIAGRVNALSDADVTAAAVAVSLATWAGTGAVAVGLGASGVVWALRPRRASDGGRWLVAVLLILLVVVGAVRADRAWSAVADGDMGDYQGWATVVRESQTYERSTRVVLELGGERYEMWGYGRNGELRLRQWHAGDRVYVSGTRDELRPERARRVAWQHVVGRFDADWVADRRPGAPVERWSNWVRGAIESAAAQLGADDGALFRGLLIGDSRDQPPEMTERFRATGLAHLTAASGLNLVYVLAVVGPLLRTLPPWVRWGVTCALIGWYVVLTRFEPSIMRAGVMGIIAATAYLRGQPQRGLRSVSLAAIILVVVDPLLVWSVGFWMSIGGTTGIVLFARRVVSHLRRLGPLALPVAVTVGAEIGVAPANLLVFERLPVVSVPANVLTGAAAGFVKMYGLPAGIVAELVPPLAAPLMAPVHLGVRWVDTVALVGEAVDPGPAGTAIAAVAVAVAGVVIWLRSRRRATGDVVPAAASSQNDRR